MASSMDGVMDNQLRGSCGGHEVYHSRLRNLGIRQWSGYRDAWHHGDHVPRNSIGSRQDVDTTSDEISRTMMPKTSRWMDGIISPRGLRDHVLMEMA